MQIRIGTRRSDLARWQAKYVSELISSAFPEVQTVMHRIGSVGDRDRISGFQSIGGIGVFTKESELELLEEKCDLVVHSLKDLPTLIEPGLVLASVPEREDPRDCLCGLSLNELKPGVRIGTGSIRRRAQLLNICSGLTIKPIRGNVPPRLRKAKNKEGIDATLLAVAGLKRLDMLHEATDVLDSEIFPYAVGQGALGIQVRSDSKDIIKMLESIECSRSRCEVDAERAMLHQLEAGCSLPVGTFCKWLDNNLELYGTVTSADGKFQIKFSASGPKEQAKGIGIMVANGLLDQGAGELLNDAGRFVFEQRKSNGGNYL